MDLFNRDKSCKTCRQSTVLNTLLTPGHHHRHQNHHQHHQNHHHSRSALREKFPFWESESRKNEYAKRGTLVAQSRPSTCSECGGGGASGVKSLRCEVLTREWLSLLNSSLPDTLTFTFASAFNRKSESSCHVKKGGGMDDLLTRHRKELRQLKYEVKKKTSLANKSGSKKTNSSKNSNNNISNTSHKDMINEECQAMERELRDRHAREIREFESAHPNLPLSPSSHESNVQPVSIMNCEQTDKSTIAPLTPSSSSTTSDTSSVHNDTYPLNDKRRDRNQTLTANLARLMLTNIPVDNTSSSVNPSAQVSTSSSGKRKVNRHRARLARRAAERDAAIEEAAREAANLPDLRQQEVSVMQTEFTRRGLREIEVGADGNCLYSSIATCLQSMNIPIELPSSSTTLTSGKTSCASTSFSSLLPYQKLRYIAADYISNHPDDFAPFLEEPLDTYVRKIRSTAEWGGHLELQAITRSFLININIIHGSGRVDHIPAVDEESSKSTHASFPQVWLAYYKHGFGLGEHYNALVEQVD